LDQISDPAVSSWRPGVKNVSAGTTQTFAVDRSRNSGHGSSFKCGASLVLWSRFLLSGIWTVVADFNTKAQKNWMLARGFAKRCGWGSCCRSFFRRRRTPVRRYDGIGGVFRRLGGSGFADSLIRPVGHLLPSDGRRNASMAR
jgi:hypothetical protein